MTDLEITKACAEAMGLATESNTYGKGIVVKKEHPNSIHSWWYDPLHDDAQAMALVKMFQLDISHDNGVTVSRGSVESWSSDRDYNRAICECVAKMQAAK